MAILDRNSGVYNSATGPWVVTRSTGNYGLGTVIVVAIMSNTVFTPAAGFTERARSTTAMGLWAWDGVGNGQASFTFTASSPGTGQWYSWELSAGCTSLDGAAAQINASSTTYQVPTMTPTAGDRHLLAVAGGNAAPVKLISSWSDGYVGWGGGHATEADFTFSQAADRTLTAPGGAGYAPVATYSATAPTRGGIHLAYVGTVADATPPTVPTNLATTAVGSTTADLSWTPSTDDVGVTGYEIQIIGA